LCFEDKKERLYTKVIDHRDLHLFNFIAIYVEIWICKQAKNVIL